MRDPNRIKPILDKLEKLWMQQPDLRLGQLIYNLASQIDADIFNLEDDRLLQLIQLESSKTIQAKGWKDKAYLLHLSGEPLTKAEVAKKLSVRETDVTVMVTVHEKLFSVHDLDGDRDLFPAFQFTNNGRLPGLRRVLYALQSHSEWTKLMFFHTQDVRLNDRTPLQALRDGDIEAVVEAAKAYGTQGAA